MESFFNVGDEVICVDSSADKRGFKSALVEGKKYIIIGIRQTCCNRISVDVGLLNPYDAQSCGKCYRIHYDSKWWFSQTRFVKADTNQQLENEIHEALKGAPIISH